MILFMPITIWFRYCYSLDVCYWNVSVALFFFFGVSVLAWQKIAARVCSKKAVACLERDFVKTHLSYHVWKNNTIIQRFWTLILIAQTAFQGCWYLTAMGDFIFCMLCVCTFHRMQCCSEMQMVDYSLAPFETICNCQYL